MVNEDFIHVKDTEPYVASGRSRVTLTRDSFVLLCALLVFSEGELDHDLGNDDIHMDPLYQKKNERPEQVDEGASRSIRGLI